jgi:hypothetical protein
MELEFTGRAEPQSTPQDRRGDTRSDEEISTMDIEDHLHYRKSEGKFN